MLLKHCPHPIVNQSEATKERFAQKSGEKYGLGNDPTKCPDDGFEWRGKGEPGSKKGSWYNPQTGEQLYPDLEHPDPIKPHWDYYGPDFPDGARLNTDGTWNPK